MQCVAIRAQSTWSTLPAVSILPSHRNPTQRRQSNDTSPQNAPYLATRGTKVQPIPRDAATCRAVRAVIVLSQSGVKRQRFSSSRKTPQPSSPNNVEPTARVADVSTSAVTSNGVAATSTVPKQKTPNTPPSPTLTKARPVPKKIRLTADERELRLIQLETAADPMASQLASDLPTDIVDEFEKRLEADIETVFTTLVAITGVIVFWRGVWSVLDHFIGDSLFGDFCCILIGLTIIFWIRLSGARLADFWPENAENEKGEAFMPVELTHRLGT